MCLVVVKNRVLFGRVFECCPTFKRLPNDLHDYYLEHSSIKNTGQVHQYYVENNHPAIIEGEMWEHVQIELERRDQMGAQYSSTDIFASKLICEDCGGFYGKKKWHSNSKYSRFIHQCNRKFHKDKDKCLTPNLMEEDIKLKFINAYNVSMKDRNRVMQDTAEIIDLLSDTTQLEQNAPTVHFPSNSLFSSP